MKTRHSISHFPGREQQAIFRLKNQIVELYNPLIIYYIGSDYSGQSARNCFTDYKDKHQGRFSCDLLVIMPDKTLIPEHAAMELENLDTVFGRIHLITHTLDFYLRQLQAYSLFFCWVQYRAIVLYEWENAAKKLPDPVDSIKQYQHQVKQFFTDNPDYDNYTQVRLSPLPENTVPIQEKPAISKQRLSNRLENNMAKFLKEHEPEMVSLHIRNLILEYIHGSGNKYLSAEFKNTLQELQGLIEFFDLAGKDINEETNCS